MDGGREEERKRNDLQIKPITEQEGRRERLLLFSHRDGNKIKALE